MTGDPVPVTRYGYGNCIECMLPLSIYNPYRVCRVCRCRTVRLRYLSEPGSQVADVDGCGMPWEKDLRPALGVIAE